jgi:cytochrome c553
MLFFTLAATSALAADEDKRQILPVSELQRNIVLEEMRALLAGTQNILAALSNNDMAAVAQHARPLGMAMARNAGAHLHGSFPKEFTQLGRSVHQDFDLIATDAETIKDPRHTLQQLSQSMGKCVACHATFQIRTGMQSLNTDGASSHRRH